MVSQIAAKTYNGFLPTESLRVARIGLNKKEQTEYNANASVLMREAFVLLSGSMT